MSYNEKSGETVMHENFKMTGKGYWETIVTGIEKNHAGLPNGIHDSLRNNMQHGEHTTSSQFWTEHQSMDYKHKRIPEFC